MNGGTISGNSATDGGGVYITSSNSVFPSFTMNGGKISGNTVSGNGGGVFIGDGYFTFDMRGGEISGNKAAEIGGGVYIAGGFFQISTGTIYGSNETNVSLRNTAPSGAVLGIASGLGNNRAQSGYFYLNNEDKWEFSPSNALSLSSGSTTNDTIKLVDGY
jgi:hypothetical protein